MGEMAKASLDGPDETRTFDKGRIDVVRVGGTTVGRITLEPGWRWSESLKATAGTESCQTHHIGYVISGRLKALADEGGEAEIGPGDAYEVRPGHDAWVVGDEPFVGLEFRSAETYGKKA
jgi:hypothetical protein